MTILNNRIISTGFLFLSLTLGCAAKANHQDISRGPAVLETLIGDNQPPCLKESDLQNPCPYVLVSEVESTAGHPKRGPRVLIIDDGMLLPGLLVHQDHVLAWYRATAQHNGDIETDHPQLRVPQGLIAVSDAVKAQDANGTLRLSDSFQSAIRPKFDRIFKNSLDRNSMGHGSPVLNAIADRTPDADFVLLHDGLGTIFESAICRVNTDSDQGYITDSMARFAQKIRDLVDSYDIDFINLSAGFTTGSVLNSFRASCPGQPAPTTDQARRFVQAFSVFFDDLSSLKKTLIFTAGLNSKEGQQPEDMASDCHASDNRVRVGYATVYRKTIEELKGVISKDGSSDEHLLPHEQQEVAACTDIFINNPVDEETFTIASFAAKYSGNGITEGPETVTSTSYATPLAIAHAVWLKAATPNLLATDIKSLLHSGSDIKIIDPTIYQQFERN